MFGDEKAREATARSFAKAVLGSELDDFANPLTVLASPAWRGVESDVWRATADGASAIIKHYHPDTSFYVDTGSAIRAAGEAGKLGVGPTVVSSSVDEGMLAFEDLSSPWRAGGLHDASSPETRSAVIAAKQAFQHGATLNNSANIFDEIDRLARIVDQANITTHNDFAVFKDFLADAQAKITSLGYDEKPCHRDGNTANLMVNPSGNVRLIDFDLAANCDPFEDIGCYLVEFFESEADARPGFEEWYGRFDEGLFQRAILYGLADDMRWGLIGSIMAAQSPRSALEFGKYASWRFLRLEMQVKQSQANNRIRMVV